ncbi:MAG TPA: DUF2314 domain-containing protein [Verrucomicrobiae bacterium]|jgi:uncharacterized protein YegJ (DUF2314 family)|nr:DUF2314 domain-containing protein [Verrucomicrobiae bacterium]
MVSYTLDSGVARREESPATFWIPPQEQRADLRPGDLVKLIFRITVDDEMHVERMWVRVTEIKPEYYIGALDNDPYCTNELQSGMRVEFHSDHVIEIDRPAT